MTNTGWTVGVDFGGTTIKVGLVDAQSRIRNTRVLPTRQYGAPRRFAEGVAAAAASMARDRGVATRRLRGIGVGAPGTVDAGAGVVRRCVNVPGWTDIPIAPWLTRRLGCPCAVDNDANAFTLAEWRLGAGRGSRALVGMTLGTGVGGGLVWEGKLLRGATGSAGEVGHMVIDAGGPRCGCGRRGCLEALIGTAAILRLARAVLRRGEGRLGGYVRRAGKLAPRVMGDAGRAGDGPSRRAWETFGHRLGIGLANLVNVLNPDRIVIGGGVANNWSLFGPAMKRTVTAEALPVPGRHVRIARGQLGDRAGILGAAVLVWELNSSGTRDKGQGTRKD